MKIQKGQILILQQIFHKIHKVLQELHNKENPQPTINIEINQDFGEQNQISQILQSNIQILLQRQGQNAEQ